MAPRLAGGLGILRTRLGRRTRSLCKKVAIGVANDLECLDRQQDHLFEQANESQLQPTERKANPNLAHFRSRKRIELFEEQVTMSERRPRQKPKTQARQTEANAQIRIRKDRKIVKLLPKLWRKLASAVSKREAARCRLLVSALLLVSLATCALVAGEQTKRAQEHKIAQGN